MTNEEAWKMALENEGLIHSWVLRYRNRPATDDEVQVGYIALRRAALTFDPDKGTFATYAWNWLRNYLNRFTGRRAELPVSKVGLNIGLSKELLDERTEKSTRSFQSFVANAKLRDALKPNLSTDFRSVFDNATFGGHLGPLIDPHDERASRELEDFGKEEDEEIMLMIVMSELDKVSERNRGVCLLYWGTDMGMREVGMLYGITRERVRQICEIVKLRIMRRVRREEASSLSFRRFFSSFSSQYSCCSS